MEIKVKKEGLAAVVTIFANVAQFMESLAQLLETGEFLKLEPSVQAEIINNTHSISRFLNETGLSLHDMIEQATESPDTSPS